MEMCDGEFRNKKNASNDPNVANNNVPYFIFAALPEVSVHEINEDWDFLVLACDGIWDVLTNQVRKFTFSHFYLLVTGVLRCRRLLTL